MGALYAFHYRIMALATRSTPCLKFLSVGFQVYSTIYVEMIVFSEMPVLSYLTISSETEGVQRKSGHLLTVKLGFVLLYA